jgi:hypothetical protein
VSEAVHVHEVPCPTSCSCVGIVKSFNKGEMPSDEWFGAQAVYRISLGSWVSGVTWASGGRV